MHTFEANEITNILLCILKYECKCMLFRMNFTKHCLHNLSFHFFFLFYNRKYQYFKFSSDEPGTVLVRQGVDSDEIKVNILRDKRYCFTSASRPAVVNAHGLTQERQRYLYHTVRPYVRPVFQDKTCPVPET